MLCMMSSGFLDKLMDDLYRENIIDHHKHPRMRGDLEPHDMAYEDENPLCGDRIRIELRVDDAGNVTEAAFSGAGCAISQAATDMLLENVVGKTVEDVHNMSKETVMDMLGIELGAVRLKCALLPLKVLKAAVYQVDDPDARTEQDDREGAGG